MLTLFSLCSLCCYRTPRLVEPLQADHEALEESPRCGQSSLFGECLGCIGGCWGGAQGLPGGLRVSCLRVFVSKRPKITGRLIASTRCRRYVLRPEVPGGPVPVMGDLAQPPF